MYTTCRYFYPHGIEGESMDCTIKEWDSLEKAIDYCHRYTKGIRFSSVCIEDEKGDIVYEILASGEIIDETTK